MANDTKDRNKFNCLSAFVCLCVCLRGFIVNLPGARSLMKPFVCLPVCLSVCLSEITIWLETFSATVVNLSVQKIKCYG